MEMYDYKINICKMKKYDDNMSDENNYFKKLNKSNYCMDIIYEHKGNTFDKILIKNKIKLKEKYSFLIQILTALDVMRKNGYTHNDLHSNNIMFKKSDYKVKIRNKNLNTKYIYSLIDYGFVNNTKFPNNKIDKFNNLHLQKNYEQLDLLIYSFSRVNILGDIYIKKKWKYNNFSNSYDTRNDMILIMYKNNNIWNKIKKKLLKLNKNYKKFYDFFEKNLKNFKNKFTKYLDSSGFKNFNIYKWVLNINLLFLAYNENEFYKIYGFTKTKKNSFLNGSDLEFLILNSSNYKKLISYFLKKYNKLK